MEFYMVLGLVVTVVAIEGWRLYDYLVNRRKLRKEFVGLLEEMVELRRDLYKSTIDANLNRGIVLCYVDKASKEVGEEAAVEEFKKFSKDLTDKMVNALEKIQENAQ